jgi:hypothetical protein
MIISHEHKFIFIKTAKTAGTSIEVFLSQHCGPNDILTPITPPEQGHEPRNYGGMVNAFQQVRLRDGLAAALRHPLAKRKKFYRHMPAWVVQTRVPRSVWEGYYKFCVERNPWEKVLSHFHMTNFRHDGLLSLDEYFAQGKFPLNYRRYTDPTGSKIIVDRVVHYENLLPGLGEVFARVGIPFNGSLGVRAKGEYRSDRRPYQEVFNSEQRDIIARAFAREIEMHGYRF